MTERFEAAASSKPEAVEVPLEVRMPGQMGCVHLLLMFRTRVSAEAREGMRKRSGSEKWVWSLMFVESWRVGF